MKRFNKREQFGYVNLSFTDCESTNKLINNNLTDSSEDDEVDLPKQHSLPAGSNNNKTNVLFQNTKPKHIAEQLTLIMHHIYTNIPFEIFNSSTDIMDNANHYTKQYTNIFNETVAWVQYSILMAINSRQRAKIIRKWINICEYLLKLNNFHGLVAVQCALKSNCVYSEKLKISWYKYKSIIKKKHHNKLQLISDIVSYKDNYSALRNKLSQCNNDRINKPVLPYWGLFKRDCLFAGELKNGENRINITVEQYNIYRKGQYTKIKDDKLIQTWIYHNLNDTYAIKTEHLERLSDKVCDLDQKIAGKKRYSLRRQ